LGGLVGGLDRSLAEAGALEVVVAGAVEVVLVVGDSSPELGTGKRLLVAASSLDCSLAERP